MCANQHSPAIARQGLSLASGRPDVRKIAGAMIGAVAGNGIEKRVYESRHYDATPRRRCGGTQTISHASEPAFKAGDKIGVRNGTRVPAG